MRLRLLFLACLVPAAARPAAAAWTSDVAVNTAVDDTVRSRSLPQTASDARGGAWVAWGEAGTTRLRHLGGDGELVAADEVVLTGTIPPGYSARRRPVLVADGPDAVLLAVVAAPPAASTVIVHRVEGGGRLTWGAPGVALRSGSVGDFEPSLAPDGAGGAIVAWTRVLRQGDWCLAAMEVRVQRIDAAGATLWGQDGLLACASPDGERGSVDVLSDGAGGAFVLWQDSSGGCNSPLSWGLDVRAQHYDASGTPRWGDCGLDVFSSRRVSMEEACLDGTGGVFIATSGENRAGTGDGAGAQHLLPDGTLAWGARGGDAGAETAESVTVRADGRGGAYVTWQAWTGALVIYRLDVSHLDAAGNLEWTTTAAGDVHRHDAIALPGGDLVVAWTPHAGPGIAQDVSAQRLRVADGSPAWGAGVPVSNAPGEQAFPALVSTSCGVIAAFRDTRTGSFTVYAQRLNEDGSPGASAGLLFVSKAWPDVVLAWNASPACAPYAVRRADEPTFAAPLDLAPGGAPGPSLSDPGAAADGAPLHFYDVR